MSDSAGRVRVVGSRQEAPGHEADKSAPEGRPMPAVETPPRRATRQTVERLVSTYADLVVQLMYRIQVDEPLTLIGRTIHLRLADLRDCGASGSDPDPTNWPVIAQGPWDLDFTLDYEDSTRTYDAGQAVVTYEDIDATPTSVRVSQVALALEFATLTHANQAESLLEQIDWDSEFLNLPVSLVMGDGRELSLGYDATTTGPQIGGGASMSADYPCGLDPADPQGDYAGTASRQLFFSRIIEPDRVSAVVINGTRIDLELVD